MGDRLLQWSQSRWTGPLVRALGLPQPARLRRRGGATSDDELAGRPGQVIGLGAAAAAPVLRRGLAALGATLVDDGPLDVLVADLTDVRHVRDVAALHGLLQPAVRRLRPSARVLLVAPAAGTGTAGVWAACSPPGFPRALARELGRRGATANAVTVASAQAVVSATALPWLHFFCSDRGAYVSGQVLPVHADTGTDMDPDTGASPPAATPPFAGRVALVTGAAGGIGAATARRLAADGAHVLCLDVPGAAPALERLASALSGTALPADITAADGVRQVQDAARRHGGLDLLVHNAGITRDRTFARMPGADWDAVLAVNLGAIVAIDAALDDAQALKRGVREVCLASIGGIAGNAGQTNYAATKAALMGHVRWRTQRLRPLGGTANAVAPGFIETAMTRRMPLVVREAGRRLNSLRQGGLPEDVAEAIAFLCRPEADGIRGQTLRVCGQSLLGA